MRVNSNFSVILTMKYPKKATNPLKLMGLRFIVQVFLVASLFFAGLICVNASDSLTSDNILIGGELDDEVVGIVEAPDGGYVLAGTTYSFGAGKADFLLIKVDDNGNVDWNNTYGGLESDVANALTPTSDGGYVLAGETSSSRCSPSVQPTWREPIASMTPHSKSVSSRKSISTSRSSTRPTACRASRRAVSFSAPQC